MPNQIVSADGDGEHVAVVASDRDEIDNLNRFLALVGKQDERAMVLSLATFLEDTLGRLLLAYFRDCKATRELVEGFNAPLGTLGSRIKAVWAFGLATEDQFKDMEILRKIRNHFAHNWEGVSLARNDIAAMLGQLSRYNFDQTLVDGDAQQRLLGTLTSCCVEMHVFVARLASGKHVKAPDVSTRLTTIAPPTSARWRYVK
jgi:DNA-binding MltR family transcriptional regulator